MKTILIVAALLFILSSSLTTGDFETKDGPDFGSGNTVEWQIVTKQNFSSQIRLHAHLLLLITLPWSGESRSVMKELARAVSTEREKFGTLRLRFMYKNNERVLADALGAREGLTILYYHHSLSYKYLGRIRPRNILASIYYVMSLVPEELPFKPLDTPEALEAFVRSTDKSVILLEFCGWASRLMDEWKNNVTGNDFGDEGNLFGTNLDGDSSKSLISREKKDLKGSKNEKITCAVEDKVTELSFLGELFSVNESTPFLKTESTRPGFSLSCTFEQFQLFESFFSKFISVYREFFVPPERQRYGFITEKSLLSFLGVEDSGPWSAMIYFAGCPGCSKLFKEVDDLKFGLQIHNSFIPELEDDVHDIEPTLSENTPSILLFVDRSSESSVTREKSAEALDSFRHLARKYQKPYRADGKNNDRPKRLSTQTAKHSKLELSPINAKTNLKDKISIMIVKDGKHVTLDNIASNSQGSSLHDILAYFRQHKKESTLSSMAKELGFQLLSDDLDIKIEDTLSSEPSQSNQLSPELALESLVKSHDELGTDPTYMDSISTVEHERIPQTVDIEPSSQYDMDKPTQVAAESQTMTVGPDIYSATDEIIINEDAIDEEKSLLSVEEGYEEFDTEGFNGSFFLSDGGYQLLRALTAGAKIPSVVIVDPLSMQHFVYPEDGIFSNSSLFDFFDGFINGSLIPYQRSEDESSVIVSPKEGISPPLVNLDFREVDSVPPVTALSLNKLVFGLNQSGTHNSDRACEEDVLVLFSNRWCGFCQRMELIVREVYRALKGYKVLNSEKRNANLEFGSDDLKDDILKFPLIYLMDCTLNECSYILKSMGQMEVYPALMLFPAEKMRAISYDGDMAVIDVIKFIAEHGTQSHHLITEKGIIRSEIQNGGKKNLSKYISAQPVNSEPLIAVDSSHEVLLKNWAPKKPMMQNKIRSRPSSDRWHVVTGSILVSTDKLINVPTFAESKILIIQSDRSSGFQGLIINKLINWDSLHTLEQQEEGSLYLEQLKDAPLSFGGPVIKRDMPLVALARKFMKHEYPEVLPGIYYLDQTATVNAIEGLRSGNTSLTDYWFFLGCSSWGWDQLFDEINDGAWDLTDKDTVQLDWPH